MPIGPHILWSAESDSGRSFSRWIWKSSRLKCQWWRCLVGSLSEKSVESKKPTSRLTAADRVKSFHAWNSGESGIIAANQLWRRNTCLISLGKYWCHSYNKYQANNFTPVQLFLLVTWLPFGKKKKFAACCLGMFWPPSGIEVRSQQLCYIHIFLSQRQGAAVCLYMCLMNT